jgi:hypothetical protein
MIALVSGSLAGLARMGWHAPLPSAAALLGHGPLMIGGFFGTVIGLERAVAAGAAWAYAAPLASGLGGLLLLAGVDAPAAGALLSLGSLGLVTVSLSMYLRQRALHTLILVLAAAAWLGGNVAWLSAAAVSEVVPLWMTFLVLTIAAERLELSRFLPPSPVARAIFVGIVVVLACGALLVEGGGSGGAVLFSAALLALALWLLRQDIARRTVRERGLTRFIAVCLLSGYGWLAIGALILLAGGGVVPGTPAYDAGLHAILLGFVFAMVFGHAPIIFPAVLGVRLPYQAWFYAPLAALHFSVALRIAGSLAGAPGLRAAGGLLNALALALFVLGTVLAAARGATGRD